MFEGHYCILSNDQIDDRVILHNHNQFFIWKINNKKKRIFAETLETSDEKGSTFTTVKSR